MNDDRLAMRIAAVLEGKRGVTRRRMFGGVCFMLHGNMVCGTAKGKLVARVGADFQERAMRYKTRSTHGFHRQSDERHGIRITGRD